VCQHFVKADETSFATYSTHHRRSQNPSQTPVRKSLAHTSGTSQTKEIAVPSSGADAVDRA
jgi:hypothetical protein